MGIFLNILLLLVGFVLLIKGADFFVDGSSSLARKLRIPSLVVGLTIVAMGTGAPEMAVSISSAAQKMNGMAVSNVVGSNLFNLLMVLGICALIKPPSVTPEILKRDYPISIGATILFIGLLLFDKQLGRIDATLFLLLMIGYLVWTVMSALKNKPAEEEEKEEKPFKAWKCALFIVGGIAAIVLGGNIVVDNASAIGSAFGMSESLIGLTICAIGTSLPELVTSIVAARKGETDMAIGNVVGSNISNILLTLGLSGVISPIAINPDAFFGTLVDCGVYIVVCLMAYIFCLTSKKITRAEGGIMVACYVAYTAYIIIRDMGI